MYRTNKRLFNELSVDPINENNENSELDYSEYYIKIGNKRRKISSLYDSLLKRDIST